MASSISVGRMDVTLRTEFGTRTANVFERGLRLRTVGDLLAHVPRRYLPTGELTPIADLVPDDYVTIIAEVQSVTTRPMKQRSGSITDVDVTDGRSSLRLTFFNQRRLDKVLTLGLWAVFTGKVDGYRGRLQLVHPEFSRLDVMTVPTQPGTPDATTTIAPLVPIYPATAGIASGTIWRCIVQVLDTLTPVDVPDPVPVEVLTDAELPDRLTALRAIHRPTTTTAPDTGLARLRYEEAFVLQVGLVQRRRVARAHPAVVRRASDVGVLAAFDEQLPFTLTAGQSRVGDQIAADLASGSPMQRLLQGEVGSGKTIVALRAMLVVVDSGAQAALLAPTEVLAVQHHRTLRGLLGDLGAAGMLGGDVRGTRVALLTGSQSSTARRSAVADVASGAVGIVVGTHALLSDPEMFADLGLVVVDEQHRFGVEQRDALRTAAQAADRPAPHLLVMTATPIPRTVAMTVFGDLDVSTLDELPAGRGDVATHVVALAERPEWLGRVWTRVREEVDAGGQAFVVCPRIGGESGSGDAEDLDDEMVDRDMIGEDMLVGEDMMGGQPADQAVAARPAPVGVVEMLDRLSGEPVLGGVRVAALHGRLPADVKDSTMSAFSSGAVDVLVATTVIEVGVDVPNASVMVILDADRFGVSQLHQLRGRIGRGSRPGVCLLVTGAEAGSPARARVDAVAATRDGLELARLDLDQRREGDVLGAAQSGRRSSLRLLRVLRDEDVITAARVAAESVVEADPELDTQPVLAEAVNRALTGGRDEFIDRA